MNMPVNSIQRADTEPRETIVKENEPLSDLRAKGNIAVPQRLEWMAVILFIANILLMFYVMQMFYDEGIWGMLTVGISTATAVILLLVAVLSLLGATRLAKFILVLGLGALMVTSLSVGIRILDQIYEHTHW